MLANFSRHHFIACFGLTLAAIGASDATAQMSAPVFGLIAGQSPSLGEIRPVFGVLGASSVQAPLRLPRLVSHVYLAPTGGWALVQLRGKEPGLVTFHGGVAGSVKTIAGAASNFQLVGFSPLGSSAGIVTSGNVIQVLTGLNATPRVAYEVNFYDVSGVKKLSVTDDGQLLAVATGAGQVYLLSNSAGPWFAYAGSASLGIAFLPEQTTLAIADAASGTLNLASLSGGAPVLRAVTSALTVYGGETLVEASSDGSSAFVVASGSASASRIDLATGAMQSMALPAVATRLDRLADGESFVFSAEPGHSAWFLNGANSGLQAVFATASSVAEVSRQ